MNVFRRIAARALLVLGLAITAAMPARAGIPVIDSSNLVQSIQSVLHSITQIENQIQQIVQLQSTLENMSGTRNLGAILNAAGLQNYIPANAQTIIDSINSGGYGSLAGTARALRDASMVYNCLDRTGPEQTRCQAMFAQPYQHKAFMQDALRSASGRLSQINGLLARVNTTTDQKGVQEIQARIAGENALLQHELSQLQAAQHMADAERNVRSSQVLERRLDNLQRTARSWDAPAP
jgi:type IV secretion system protein VirB5